MSSSVGATSGWSQRTINDLQIPVLPTRLDMPLLRSSRLFRVRLSIKISLLRSSALPAQNFLVEIPTSKPWAILLNHLMMSYLLPAICYLLFPTLHHPSETTAPGCVQHLVCAGLLRLQFDLPPWSRIQAKAFPPAAIQSLPRCFGID